MIDSQSVCGQLILAEAIQRRLERGTDDDEIDALVERFQREAGILFTVDTLDYLVRGGRVGKAAGFAGELLSVKPILSIRDGEVHPLKRVRGRAKALAELERIFDEATTDSPTFGSGSPTRTRRRPAQDLLEPDAAPRGPRRGRDPRRARPRDRHARRPRDARRLLVRRPRVSLSGVPPVAHWDDVEPIRRERGHIAGSWRDLGEAAGSSTVGSQRIEVDPGMWSTPLHLEGAEEEIFFVLGGSGHSFLWRGDDDTGAYAVGEGDCLVHLALEEAHTLHAGPDGLDVLAFGMRTYADSATYLPRAGVSWLGATWVESGGEENHPWTREVAAGPADFPVREERPSTIVNLDDVETQEFTGDTVAHVRRDLGTAAGSLRSGVEHVTTSRPGC